MIIALTIQKHGIFNFYKKFQIKIQSKSRKMQIREILIFGAKNF